MWSAMRLSAGPVERAEDWQRSSLWVRQHGTAEQKSVLTDWPTPRPANWLDRVNSVITAKEKSRWDLSRARSQPFGDDAWSLAVAKELGLEYTMRGEGGVHGAKREDGDEP